LFGDFPIPAGGEPVGNTGSSLSGNEAGLGKFALVRRYFLSGTTLLFPSVSSNKRIHVFINKYVNEEQTMTRKLEELFDLPTVDNEVLVSEEDTQIQISEN